MEQGPHIGDRITDKSASPNDATVRDWVGPEVFGHWSWRPQLVKLYDEAQTYHDGKWLKVGILSTDDRHDVMGLLSMKRRPSARG